MTHAAPRKNAVIFHGWLIVLVAFICFAVNTGLIFYAWGAFLVPLGAEFGGRARVSGAYSAMQIAVALYGLIVGRLVDRHGGRLIEIVGAIVLGIGFACMSLVQTLPQLYLCMAGPIAVGSVCIGGLPNNAAVARWFVRKRGTAFGIATAGISAGGIICAPLAQWLIDTIGWRQAYLVLGLSVVAIIWPPVFAFMRRDPADLGLEPDGEHGATTRLAVETRTQLEAEIARSLRSRDAMRHPNFWLLAVAFGLTMTGLSSTLLFLIQILMERGMTADRASLVLGATAAMGVVGKLGFGRLVDRYDGRRVSIVCFVLQALGVLLLWTTRSPIWLAAYVVLYGYAMGGNATLQASLLAEAFGRLHYGAITGRMTPFVMGTQAVGIPLAGWLRDRTGSWDAMLAGVVAASVVGVAVVWHVRLPARHRTLAGSPTIA